MAVPRICGMGILLDRPADERAVEPGLITDDGKCRRVGRQAGQDRVEPFQHTGLLK